MDYQEFKKRIKKYDDLYQVGLKKQANQYIREFVLELQIQTHKEIDDILYSFLSDYCDKNDYEYLRNRGNGRIPFALDQYLKDWLYQRCLDNKMPELRWFFEMYYQDSFGYQYAFDFLRKAYENYACDYKTVQLLFETYIETLQWGAHHFPESCILNKETRDDAISHCYQIMNEKTVCQPLQNEFQYYKVLYACYDLYINDGKKKNFEEYCKEANIDYYECKAYFYENK